MGAIWCHKPPKYEWFIDLLTWQAAREQRRLEMERELCEKTGPWGPWGPWGPRRWVCSKMGWQLWDMFSLFFCGKVMIKDQFDKWFAGTVPCCTILYPIFRQSWKNRSIDPGWAFKHQRHSLCGHEQLRSQCTKGLPLVGKVSKYVNSMKSFKKSIPWHPSNVWLIPNSLQKLVKKHPQKNRWRGQSCGSSEADSGRQGSRPNRFGAGFLETTNVHQSIPNPKLIIGARERWFEKFEVPLGFRSLKEWVSEILRCAGIHWHENHSQRRLWDLFKKSEGKIVSEAKLRLPFGINSFWVWIYQIISSHSKNSWVTSVGEWLDGSASGLPWFLCCVDDQSFAEPGPKWVSLIMGYTCQWIIFNGEIRKIRMKTTGFWGTLFSDESIFMSVYPCGTFGEWGGRRSMTTSHSYCQGRPQRFSTAGWRDPTVPGWRWFISDSWQHWDLLDRSWPLLWPLLFLMAVITRSLLWRWCVGPVGPSQATWCWMNSETCRDPQELQKL